MRVAVISDIHGNLHALEAVLRALEPERPDEIWCLGDVVGYGPRPNECCATVAERATLALCGNHDLGVLGTLDLRDFAHDAATAAHWTRRTLTGEAREYLEQLRPAAVRSDGRVELYHASPRDPVWEYILTDAAAEAAFGHTSAPLILVGHSHVALAVAHGDGAIHGGLAPDGTELDLRERRWLLNPGSVGQPRDGDARAAYVLVDLERRFATFRRVAYSVAETQREIRELQLPEALAIRLAHGI